MRQWAASNADGGPKNAAAHIKTVQIVEAGDTQQVFLHTDLPHAEDGKPPP
ncbi:MULTISPECIES: hypothetical protein [unclassified Streptomyces]|uniref:hypothetical protein n=1 Tax=unclassified Streptomyces TaxID=2593676 RepID=UPI0029A74954|nr:hypothetical protein [Streptomyces sp. DK15]MDX2395023.1 hypothetical protein [Streptomyces sp. DK15]